MYLPLSTMTPVFVGGCLRRWVELRSGGDKEILEKRRDQGVLLGSGLIAGEGIMGVAIAFYAFFAGRAPAGIGWHWRSGVGDLVSLYVWHTKMWSLL